MKTVDRQIGYKTGDDEDDDVIYISLPSSVSNDFLLVKRKVIESISKRLNAHAHCGGARANVAYRECHLLLC